MAIKRGSSVDRVGLEPQSNVAASDPTTGMNPIALPDAPMAPVLKDGGMNERVSGATGCDTSCGRKNFVANDGCKNP